MFARVAQAINRTLSSLEQAQHELMASETGQEVKREVDQVDKVIQAMSLTDGGLSQREFDRVKTEAAELAGAVPDAPEPPAVADLPATDSPSVSTPDSRPA